MTTDKKTFLKGAVQFVLALAVAVGVLVYLFHWLHTP
jgi:hypothetical protein